MKILCVDSWLARAFTDLGHDVLAARPDSGVADVLELLEQRRFRPDLVFQQESLHRQVLLKNLERVSCPAIFWSLDTHLNIHWHKYYARLFDAVGTPHVSFFARVPPLWTPQRLFRLPMFGADRPYRPHAGRARARGFVGVDNPETRSSRSRFFRLLQPLGLTAVSGLDREEMLEFYRDTRLVPNESIAFEVNFRLAEAACAGACAVSPDVGPDQDEQYEPGREILVYGNGPDLVEKLGFFLRRADLTEKIGRAAWEKTQARHLARHRAQTVLETAAGLLPGPRDPVHLDMALAQRSRHVRLPMPGSLLERLDRPDRPEALALFLRCLSEFFPGEATERAMRRALPFPSRPPGRPPAQEKRGTKSPSPSWGTP
jgi:hypothetical protein